MRKIILILLAATFFTIQHVSAVALPNSLTNALDRIVASMSDYWSVLPHAQKIEKYQWVIVFLDKVKPQVASTKIPVLEYIQSQFQQKIENNQFTENSIPNVDLEQVRQTWTRRHNEARAKKWLPAYKYHNALEHTAFVRAKYLASINASTHKRLPSDNYYNYTSIKNRFASFGIYFDESRWTAFSENIAYQYYSCNKSDCTQDLINAIKKWFDFFMSEASYNGAHYRAIMHPYFTEMGLWIGFVGKRYYIVTHYGHKIQ